jgi:sortase (surface protein transpeptidase)
VKAILAKEFHIQPSEFDIMPMWEYELFMKELNNAIKEDNKRNQEEEEKYNLKDIKKYSSPESAKREAMKSVKIPSMPSYPSGKIPKF